jgi:formylglycine-generating enzyme required for sulfatase activity
MRKTATIWLGGVLLAGMAVAHGDEQQAPVPHADPQQQLVPGPPPTPEDVGEMVLVPAGEFVMGSDKVDVKKQAQEYGSSKPWYVDEHPQHKVNLPAFYIDKYEVTNAQYREFVVKTDYWFPPSWKDNGYLLAPKLLEIADLPTLRKLASDTFHLDMDTRTMDRDALTKAISEQQAKLDKLPVAEVNWFNAHDYCAWVGKRMPTEAEWEKAARGSDAREYPWGNDWDKSRLNAGEAGNWEFGVAPVGSYPTGASPYGVMDMSGNVMEWVRDWYEAYPGNKFTHETFGKKYKVVRGGGWGGVGHYALSQFYRSAYRLYMSPDAMYADIGFRCAKDAK